MASIPFPHLSMTALFPFIWAAVISASIFFNFPRACRLRFYSLRASVQELMFTCFFRCQRARCKQLIAIRACINCFTVFALFVMFCFEPTRIGSLGRDFWSWFGVLGWSYFSKYKRVKFPAPRFWKCYLVWPRQECTKELGSNQQHLILRRTVCLLQFSEGVTGGPTCILVLNWCRKDFSSRKFGINHFSEISPKSLSIGADMEGPEMFFFIENLINHKHDFFEREAPEMCS